jgi:putative transposase
MAVFSGAVGLVFAASGWLGRIDQQLVMNALQMAIVRCRPGPGLIHHTDQSRQYAAALYVEVLKTYGMLQSMSRREIVMTMLSQRVFLALLRTS